MCRYISILLCCLLSLATSYAQDLSSNAQVSLLTCHPGEELYERYGHTAIRICDPEKGIDVVFNYGLFSFDTDHFYYKFVKGETYYQLGLEYTSLFKQAYAREHRTVSEQVLNMSVDEQNRLWQALLHNYEPAHREYLYNFVFDNCATRPYTMIINALTDSVESSYTGHIGCTYREFLTHYTGRGSWADFGINLLFGRRADQPMTSEERLFLPEELMLYIDGARLANGEKLVRRADIAPFAERTTPWYQTSWFTLTILTLLLLLLSVYDRRRGKLSYWVDIILIILYLIVLTIVIFLTFFSIHPLVGFGWRLLIIPSLHVCARIPYIIR